MPARTTRPNEVLCSSSQTPTQDRGDDGEDQQAIAREQEVAEEDRAAKRLRDRGRDRRRAPDNPDRLFGDHGEPERHQQAQDRIGVVEPAQDEALEENAEQRHGDRRQHHRRTEAEIFRDLDGDVGAERIERAVREIDDAADAEDQRQAERDQEVIAPEHQAIHHLLQQKSELHMRSATLKRALKKRRRRRSVPAPQRQCARRPDSGFYAFMLQGFCVFVG